MKYSMVSVDDKSYSRSAVTNLINSGNYGVDIVGSSDKTTANVDVLYPGYVRKAVTFSYDDCIIQDEKLIGIFNKNGLKGSFNLISNRFTSLSPEGQQEIYERYSGHEVTNHTRTHPRMYLTKAEIINGVTCSPVSLEDCKADIKGGTDDIKALFGAEPEGMVWPYMRPSGRSDYHELLEFIKGMGFKYIRPVETTGSFELPKDWHDWRATCHSDGAKQYIDSFLNLEDNGELKLFYIWGHCYEFDESFDPENPSKMRWQDMEELANTLGARADIWKATNIEIYDYIEASRSLEVDYSNNIIKNPSGCDVYVQINGIKTVIPAHGTAVL